MNDVFVDNYFGISDYDMAVSSMMVKPNKSQSVTEIETAINEFDVWDAELLCMKDVMDSFPKEVLRAHRENLFVGSCVVVVLISAVVAQIVIFIKIKKKKNDIIVKTSN